MFIYNENKLANLFVLWVATWFGLIGYVLFRNIFGVLTGFIPMIIHQFLPEISTYQLKRIGRKNDLQTIQIAEGNIKLLQEDEQQNILDNNAGQLYALANKLVFIEKGKIEMVILYKFIKSIYIEKGKIAEFDEELYNVAGNKMSNSLIKTVMSASYYRLCIEIDTFDSVKKYHFIMASPEQWKDLLLGRVNQSQVIKGA